MHFYATAPLLQFPYLPLFDLQTADIKTHCGPKSFTLWNLATTQPYLKYQYPLLPLADGIALFATQGLLQRSLHLII